MSPSSRGLGLEAFNLSTGVRISLGTPKKVQLPVGSPTGFFCGKNIGWFGGVFLCEVRFGMTGLSFGCGLWDWLRFLG